MIRGIRGATTVNANSEKEIIHETEKLLREMIDRNQLKSEEVASVLISVTEEITATFPAKAMRKIEGWKFVPVMCVKRDSRSWFFTKLYSDYDACEYSKNTKRNLSRLFRECSWLKARLGKLVILYKEV